MSYLRDIWSGWMYKFRSISWFYVNGWIVIGIIGLLLIFFS